jgi:hypothetical protein
MSIIDNWTFVFFSLTVKGEETPKCVIKWNNAILYLYLYFCLSVLHCWATLEKLHMPRHLRHQEGDMCQAVRGWMRVSKEQTPPREREMHHSQTM